MSRRSVVRYRQGRSCLLLCSLVSLGAGAADVTWLPSIQVSGYYDDNYRLTEIRGQEVEVSGGIAEVQLALCAATPTTEFRLTPRLVSTYFPGERAENQNDGFLRAELQRTGRRVSVGVASDFQYEIVRDELSAAELEGDLGAPLDEDDIGVVKFRNRREFVRVAPSVAVDLTERSRLEVRTAYSDVTFERSVLFENEDYANLDAELGIAVETSPTSTLSVRGRLGEFRPRGGLSNSQDSSSVGVAGEWSLRYSDVRRYYLRGGVTRTDFDSAGGAGADRSETSFVGGVGTSWQFQVTKLLLNLTREVQPNATGRLVERDELRVRLTRSLSPRLEMSWTGRGIRTEQVARDGVADDREFLSASVGFEWRLGPRMSLIGSYDYSWREFSRDMSDARSNAVMLGLAYKTQLDGR